MTWAIPDRPKLFTIGHSDHEFPRFVELIRSHGVTAIADVRSQPFSRMHPHFSRDPLTAQLHAERVSYVFLGRELGARRHEREAYCGQQAKYELIAQLPLFRQGLERLQKGAAKHKIALLCAEKDPLTCHRTVLVCRHLRDIFDIRHILADGAIETQAAAEQRLLRLTGLDGPALFRTPDEVLQQAYEAQGERIAFTENVDGVEPTGGRGAA